MLVEGNRLLYAGKYMCAYTFLIVEGVMVFNWSKAAWVLVSTTPTHVIS